MGQSEAGLTSVFYTPRFSYDGVKLAICACPAGPATVASAVYSELQGGYSGPGGYSRVGIPGGYMEGYTGTPSHTARGASSTAKRAP